MRYDVWRSEHWKIQKREEFKKIIDTAGKRQKISKCRSESFEVKGIYSREEMEEAPDKSRK